jgi:membrane associated rhomboid family serine protease
MNLGSGYSLPKGIKYLIFITIGVYILQILPSIGYQVTVFGGLIPFKVFRSLQIWRLVTYIFLHGSLWHIAWNLLALWMFGSDIESTWGTRRFITFYLISGIGAGILSFPMWHANIIGASGALLAVLTVFAYYYPHRRILMFFVFPVPSRIAVVIIGAISILMAGQQGGIAHLTHLGGIIVAILYLRYYNKVVAWDTHRRAVNAEKTMRRRAETKIQKDRYFEEVIDPILKKISERGMDSLTDKEKKELKRASDKDQGQ